MHRLVFRVLRSPIPIALAIVFATMLGSACQVMVVEPLDESSSYQGSIKFWGYSASPGEQVRLEAQSTTWELLATATTSSVPTHSAGFTGYYYEVWTYGPSIPTRFRKTSPYASSGYWRTTFRVIGSSGGVATTRQYQVNSNQPTTTNWLERYWQQHTTATSTIRIDIHP